MVDAIRDHYTAVGTNVIRASNSKEAQQWREDEAALLIDGAVPPSSYEAMGEFIEQTTGRSLQGSTP